MGRILVGSEGDVAIVTVESAGRLNAFTRAMRGEISGALAAIDADSRCAGAVLTGAGAAFCAGQDLNESAGWGDDVPWVEEFADFFESILRFRKPLIAAVNGAAAGGGFQMALLCDSRIGHAATTMGQPEVRRGLASVTGTWLLQRAVGDLRARELALSGRMMGAEELARLGMLDAIVPAAELPAAAVARCQSFAVSPSDSYARTKSWLHDSLRDEMRRVFADAVRLHREGFSSGVSQHGARAFLDDLEATR